MPKLKKIDLSKSFVPVDLSFLKVGDQIEFDCYIQKFNGFCLIIEAATKLSQRHIQILVHTRKHYVTYNQLNFYKKISAEHKVKEKEIISFEELQKEQLEKFSLEKKVIILYNSLSKIIEDLFLHNKAIDSEYFDLLLHHFILMTRKDKVASRYIINFMPKEDTHWNHSVNVALLAIVLGNYMQYSIVQMRVLATAAFLHDIGKKEISANIFEKNAKLSVSEIDEMHKHPLFSAELAKDMGVEERAVLDAIMHHHEYLDGSGYPDHLRSQRISDFTQIITICDIFDGMTSYRSYRNKKSALSALKMIRSEYSAKIRSKIIDSLLHLFYSIYSTEAKN